jgi:hypothetical protein
MKMFASATGPLLPMAILANVTQIEPNPYFRINNTHAQGDQKIEESHPIFFKSSQNCCPAKNTKISIYTGAQYVQSIYFKPLLKPSNQVWVGRAKEQDRMR